MSPKIRKKEKKEHRILIAQKKNCQMQYWYIEITTSAVHLAAASSTSSTSFVLSRADLSTYSVSSFLKTIKKHNCVLLSCLGLLT